MNRLGRGYSFEALRAKIMFAEGAHKHKLSRPRFERRREPEPAVLDMMTTGIVGYGLPTKPAKHADQHRRAAGEKNYGVDISTLTRMIERGEI